MSPRKDGALRLPWDHGQGVDRRLGIRNRAFDVARRMREAGKRMPLPPEVLTPGTWDDGVGEWSLPRGVAWDDAEDATVLPPSERLTTSLVLRDYQRGALTPWWRGERNGVVEAPCGAGKTAIGIAALAVCETPGLVLVHTRDLLNQWTERANEVGLSATPISEGAGPTTGRIVVATMQTVGGWDPEQRRKWGKHFGLVVVDEVHHAPCETMGACLYDLPGRWRLGLTATPDRVDGLTPWIHAHMGPTVHVIERAALVKAGRILVPVVRRMRSGWTAEDDLDYGDMVTAATQDEERTGRILDVVLRRAREGRRVLLLTERKAHAERMGTLLAEAGIATVVVHGEVTPKKRKERIAAVDRGDARVLVATQLADEGLDLVGLDTLVLAAPQKHVSRLEQRVGRICRPMEGKPTPEVWDFTDGGWAEKLWHARKRVYARLGCTIEDSR